MSQEEMRLGSESSLSVYWVGHSLVEQKADTDWGRIDLMSAVGLLAKARGLAYAAGDHTLWGSALSALWRGSPHGHARDARSMVPKREVFQRDAARYDTLVATELLPLDVAMNYEFSAYYLRQFLCAQKTANPAARVYVYQTWVNLQGGAQASGSGFDWRARMLAQRKAFDTLADQAAQPSVRTPGPFGSRWLSYTTDGGCNVVSPILTVPVGATLVEIHDRIAAPRDGDRFELPDGRRLTLGDLFANPYLDWPSAGQRLRDPSRPHDDIHASALGIYLSALVHFATLYRQSPVGLPAPSVVGPALAATLQCIAWQTVVRDPRSGAAGDEAC